MDSAGPPGSAERRGSLVVVGTGITLARQTTLEAVACIQRAEKLFFLVTNPATEGWIRRLNPSATTLEDCYNEGKSRFKTYREMADRILAAVRAGLQVCAAFYGHPGVFVRPSHDAIRRARREGFPARMLPGVSAEDCLFADLGMNPGEEGCQSFEATDFLACRRRFDPSSALILWQVGVLGEPGVRKSMACRPERLRVLTDVLRRHYSARHPVVLYEAAQFPICEPMIERMPLAKLPQATVLPLTTLYVPPRPSRTMDPKVLRWLDAE
jgi:uncharacterized protein YabN with tetrapyrrole methylase and pyrophosphatase domain